MQIITVTLVSHNANIEPTKHGLNTLEHLFLLKSTEQNIYIAQNVNMPAIVVILSFEP